MCCEKDMETTLEDSNKGASSDGNKPRVALVAAFSLIACLGAFLMGFNEGYATQTLDELNSTLGADSIRSNALAELSAFNAIFPVGALVGGLFAGWASDTFGRKPSIVAGALPQLFGWAALSAAHFVPQHIGFLSTMLAGRFLAGLGAGWNSLCVPVYITEISPVNQRGFFGSWNQLFVCIGYLAALSLGIPEGNFHYYYVSLVALATNLLFALTMLCVEESPVWLFASGKSEKGERVLRRLRGPNVDVNREIDDINSNMIQTDSLSLTRSLLQLRHCSVMAPFLLSMMLMFFMQFGGINALAYYASQQLEQAGVPEYRIVSSLTVGGTLVLFAVLSVLIVERVGRKVLLVASSVGMMASCVMLAVDFYLVSSSSTSSSDSQRYSPLAIVSSVVYNASFSIGWGPLPWVMMSELVPTSVRGISTGVSTALNWGFVAVVTFGVTYYEVVVHPYGAWFTFGGVMLASIFCVVFLLPETRGRTMEEIQLTFESFSYRRYLFPKGAQGAHSEREPLLFDSIVGKGLQYM